MQSSCTSIRVACSALLLFACARKHGDAVAGDSTPKAGNGAATSRPSVSKDSDPSRVGAKATAKLEPVAAASDGDSTPVSGTASFSETSAGVDLTIGMRGCAIGKTYPLFIQAGGDCSSASLLGARWDSPRGENINEIMCTGTTGMGRTFYTRPKQDAKPWTIGNPAASNILGHVLVAYDSATLQPIACGPIVRAEDAPPVTAPAKGQGPSSELKAQLAGLCLGRQIVRDNAQTCPDPEALARCAGAHCELDACVPICADYLACLEQESDPCQSACLPDNPCSDCQNKVWQCTLGFCLSEIACASPVTPDGPCAQLEACCAMQGDGAASCLETVHLLEKLSGDPSCFGAMHDWDTTSHLSVPCKFQ
jgi:hypothetical protein